MLLFEDQLWIIPGISKYSVTSQYLRIKSIHSIFLLNTYIHYLNIMYSVVFLSSKKLSEIQTRFEESVAPFASESLEGKE